MTNNGRMLTGAEILASGGKLHLESVPTPEWGGPGASTYIIRLSGLEASATQKCAAAHVDGKGMEGESMTRWCVLGCCDANGKPIFSDADRAALIKTPMAALQRVTFAIMKLNGITKEEEETEKKPVAA